MRNAIADLYQELGFTYKEYVIDLTKGNSDGTDERFDVLCKNTNDEIYTERTKGILYETIVEETINIEKIQHEILNIQTKQYDLDKVKLKSIPEIFVFLNSLRNNIKELTKEILANKPNSLLYWKLASIFKQPIQPENCELIEFEGQLINNEQNRIYFLQSIDQFSYIDTPMSLGKRNPYGKNNENDHWIHLNKTIRNYTNNCLLISDLDSDKQDILNGALEYSSNY